MRLLPLALVLAAAPAVAGPPEVSHLDWYAFARDEDGLWVVGSDSCDEAGMKPVAARVDGKEVTYDAERVRALDGKRLPAGPWRTGKDVYELGDKPRLSHDGGKTWKPLTGAGEGLRAVAGTDSDHVFGIAWRFIVVTPDHGASWTRYEMLIPPRKCVR